MKRTNSVTKDAKKEHLDRICQELGADTIKKLHRAFELTAAALYRRAHERASLELKKSESCQP
jgi:hypothetical protein